MELSYTARGSINWNDSFRELFVHFNSAIYIPTPDSAVPLLDMCLIEMLKCFAKIHAQEDLKEYYANNDVLVLMLIILKFIWIWIYIFQDITGPYRNNFYNGSVTTLLFLFGFNFI